MRHGIWLGFGAGAAVGLVAAAAFTLSRPDNSPPPPAATTSAPASSVSPAPPALGVKSVPITQLASTAPRFTRQQLDQLLAPIALYPDRLLVQVLMAATFPRQVVDAADWLRNAHKAELRGDALVAALEPLPWDPSVKSLIAFPQLMMMMRDHLAWTEALGLAFADQRGQTMARVQYLRHRSVAAGRLKSSRELEVRGEEGDIVIEPADPSTIYVPVYNPAEVYGRWPDSEAPPVYLPPPPDFYRGQTGPGIGYSVGFGVVAPLWGWGRPDWHHHEVAVDPHRFRRITTQTNTINNNIVIQNNTWQRVAPVATLPVPSRPQRPAEPAHVPPGTLSPTAIRAPAPSNVSPPTKQEPAQPPHPVETPHPPAPAAKPAPHPVEATHPTPAAKPAPAPHLAETPHPPAPAGKPAPHPVEATHPPPATKLAPAPHPVEATHPTPATKSAPPPHSAETPRPSPAAKLVPAPHPAEATHPTPATKSAPPPHPAETPRPSPAAKLVPAPHPVETLHPQERKPLPNAGEEQKPN